MTTSPTPRGAVAPDGTAAIVIVLVPEAILSVRRSVALLAAGIGTRSTSTSLPLGASVAMLVSPAGAAGDQVDALWNSYPRMASAKSQVIVVSPTSVFFHVDGREQPM